MLNETLRFMHSRFFYEAKEDGTQIWMRMLAEFFMRAPVRRRIEWCTAGAPTQRKSGKELRIESATEGCEGLHVKKPNNHQKDGL